MHRTKGVFEHFHQRESIDLLREFFTRALHRNRAPALDPPLLHCILLLGPQLLPLFFFSGAACGSLFSFDTLSVASGYLVTSTAVLLRSLGTRPRFEMDAWPRAAMEDCITMG
jgi:hypothetical protein